MGLGHSPSTVMDGLVFSMDAGNSRSYSGSGLTTFSLLGSYSNSLVNGVGFTTANAGSFVFDGTNDYISTANIDLSNTNKISVSCWVKILNYRENSGSSNIVYEFSTNFNSSSTGFVAAFADGSPVYSGLYPIALGVRGNSGYDLAAFSKTLVNDLAWHHWTCIFDKSLSSGNENILYIDGILRASILNPLSADNSNNFASDKLYIGNRGDGSNIAGNANITDLKIYNRALSAAEVKQNYNATKRRFGL
jgi:hypothetical protein